MDPQRLTDTYGDRIMFWGGGTDTQTLSNFRTVEEVRENARKLLEIFAAKGNYVFTQVHNFQADVSPEVIMAIYDEAQEFRRKMELGE